MGGEDGAPLRNRHEVAIRGGHVSLCCLFDPAVVGVERHRPGAYSSYGPPTLPLSSLEYQRYVGQLALFDDMVDTLSEHWAKATADPEPAGALDLYHYGLRAQLEHEATLAHR